MTTVTIYLYEAENHKFEWFNREWMEAWKYTASKIMNFRKGYKHFYVAPDRLFFVSNFDMSEKEFIELVSFATIHYNKFFNRSKVLVLTAHKTHSDIDTNYLTSQVIYTHERYKEALTKYYTDLNKKQMSLNLISDAFEVKPEFTSGYYYENNEWKIKVDVSISDTELGNHDKPYPSMDEIQQTKRVQSGTPADLERLGKVLTGELIYVRGKKQETSGPKEE